MGRILAFLAFLVIMVLSEPVILMMASASGIVEDAAKFTTRLIGIWLGLVLAWALRLGAGAPLLERIEVLDCSDQEKANTNIRLAARLADQQARHEVELRALQSQIAELERDRDRLRGLLRAPGLYPPTETPEAVAARHLKGVDQDPPLQPAEEPGP